MPAPKSIKLTPAKGRPMLHWIGKKPLTQLPVFPAQHIESFDPENESTPAAGHLYHGDNKEVLAHLLANGYRSKINLIYIDPPFDSGADYVRKVQLRGPSATNKLDGEHYSLGEQIQYTDIWANDNYLQFMYERLILLKELLAEGGSIYLHCDPRRSAYLRIVLDEVFGQENFRNEIIWERTNAHNMKSGTFAKGIDAILFYTAGSDFTFNEQTTDLTAKQLSRYKKDEDGRFYTGQDLTFSGSNPERQFEWRGTTPPPNRSWGSSLEDLEKLWEEGRILTKLDGTPRLDGYKVFLDEKGGKKLSCLWNDVFRVANTGAERTEYPTQKPEPLLERILEASSNPNDLVLDCFIGSGTTAAVAQKLGRRWIGADINKGAIQTSSKRLQTIIRDQLAEREKAASKGGELIADENAPPAPAALSFEVHRVNDYDLQIQHNEAVALACEHIGVQRDKKDGYFDGTEGQRLVKVIPFNHPLSPADLEQLRHELKTRPAEERNILLIALGQEPKAEQWLKDWNRLRKRGDVPNKIEVIELRTDAKYGKFLQHTPCSAEISLERDGDQITLTIDDFTSPSILERLATASGGLVKAHVKDWRSMVDCVLIDADHDGETFRITMADHPEKKTDLVQGSYTIEARKGSTIAIKIIDMLGEELLLTQSPE